MQARAGSRVHISMTTSRIFSVAALLFVLGAGAARAGTIPPGSTAPDWKLPDLQDKPVHLSDFKGKVIILDFWATWCPPCVAEVPKFVALQKKFQDKDVVFIGVATDDLKPAVAAFIKRVGINYPIVLGDEDVLGRYSDDPALPLTLVINRQGKIATSFVGTAPPEGLEKIIDRLL